MVKVPASLPAGTGYLKFTARDPSRKLLGAFSTKSSPVKVQPTTTEVAESDGSGESSGSLGDGGGGGGNDSNLVAPLPVETDGNIQCPANSPEVTFAANSETNENARYAHTGAPGTYRLEIVSPEDLSDDDYANYTWANDPDYKQNRIHSGYFFVTKDELPRFENGRVANPTLSFGGAYKDPPYDNSRTAVANDTRGLDQQLTLATGDTLYFVVNGIQGQYGRYSGSIHVRICAEVISNTPSPTPNATSGPISHFLYQGEHGLTYTSNSSGQYRTDIISRVNYGFALSIDKNGKAHLVFVNIAGELMYATNESGNWQTVKISSDAVAKSNYDSPSITVDDNGKIHISYASKYSPYSFIVYATNKSGAWTFENVADRTSPGYNNQNLSSSIAVDSNRNIHIAYFNKNALEYATNVSGSWTMEKITPASDVVTESMSPSLKLDNQNKPHITYPFNYRVPPFLALNYSTNASGKWVTTPIDSIFNSIDRNSFALDSQGKAYVAYSKSDLHCQSCTKPYYATNKTGPWVINQAPLDQKNVIGWSFKIAIDTSDKLHFSFSDSTRRLWYLKNIAGEFSTEKIADRVSYKLSFMLSH